MGPVDHPVSRDHLQRVSLSLQQKDAAALAELFAFWAVVRPAARARHIPRKTNERFMDLVFWVKKRKKVWIRGIDRVGKLQDRTLR